MSEQENNVCEVCGGWKRIAYTIEFRECTPHSISIDPNTVIAPFKLCPGHPELAPKHDGRLDGFDGATVGVDEYPHVVIASRGDEEARYREAVCLTPAQALSLLAWLEQNREELQRLAKEQECG